MLTSMERVGQALTARAFHPAAADVEPGHLLPAAVLEAVRRRNALLDGFFYDVGTLTDEEARDLSPWLAAEGAVLFVPPTGRGSVLRMGSVDDFVDFAAGSVDTLAVAGVGSSALGAAALARNVADAFGKPVAAVVSGYGLADAVTEGLGGALWFGALNSSRRYFEYLDRAAGSRPPADPLASVDVVDSLLLRQSLDTQTVYALLMHPRLALRRLVGHSKGNLVVSEALYAVAEASEAKIAQLGRDLDIVTISAKIYMPDPYCRHVIDVMGQYDAFGLLNSRADVKTDVSVPGAGHHTNTRIFGHVPVTAVLAQLLHEGRLRPA
jgi:hypothetical protein